MSDGAGNAESYFLCVLPLVFTIYFLVHTSPLLILSMKNTLVSERLAKISLSSWAFTALSNQRLFVFISGFR